MKNTTVNSSLGIVKNVGEQEESQGTTYLLVASMNVALRACARYFVAKPTHAQ